MTDAKRLQLERSIRKALRTLGKTRGGAYQQIGRRFWNSYQRHARAGHPDPHRSEELLYLAYSETTRAMALDLTQRS